MGERYLIPTLYTRVSVRLTTPTQKSVSIDTSGNGVNLPDCTDLCNRLKIERVSMPSKLSVCRVKKDYAARFRAACVAAGTTPNAVLKQAADDFLKEHPADEDAPTEE